MTTAKGGVCWCRNSAVGVQVARGDWADQRTEHWGMKERWRKCVLESAVCELSGSGF